MTLREFIQTSAILICILCKMIFNGMVMIILMECGLDSIDVLMYSFSITESAKEYGSVNNKNVHDSKKKHKQEKSIV